MKTQIINLNRNDDYLSVRDKMNWCQTGRVLLVWPDQGHVLNRLLELTLVKRHASMIGVQLALVTHDSEVQYYAHQIGISVFDSSRRAQDSEWKVGQVITTNIQPKSKYSSLDTLRKFIRLQSPKWLEYPITRVICFGISLLALMILGIFILPSAKIILFPLVEIQSMRFNLSADPATSTINLNTGSLPPYNQDIIVEGQDTITTTGSVVISNEPAVAELKFTNVSNQIIRIPVGSIVTSLSVNPIRFITSSLDKVTVEPGESVSLPSRAIKPGTSGNLPANSLVALEGELRLDLTVTNPEPTYGGTDASFPSPTTRDLQLLRDHLRGKLEQVALINMQSILPEDDILITPTLKIIDTLGETYTPTLGEPGEQVQLSLRLHLQSEVVSGITLRNLVTSILNSNTPLGYSPLVNTLVITMLSNPTLGNDGIAHWTVLSDRKLKADISEHQIVDIIKGTDVPHAVELLSVSLPLTEKTQIILNPKWWPRLPFLTMRIEVVQSEFR